jgi:hypothetical protein
MTSSRAQKSCLHKVQLVIASRILSVLLVSVLVVGNAEAQQTDSLRLGFSAHRALLASPHALKPDDRALTDSTSDRITSTANGALIGAGVGAAAGLIGAFVATHQAKVTDHSEDGVALVVFVSFGAFVGLLIGGIVGFVRS